VGPYLAGKVIDDELMGKDQMGSQNAILISETFPSIDIPEL